jgi:hypothetical protein
MILTDYYKAVQIAKSQTRFDVEASSENYPNFESLMRNQIGFNKGGLSFHFSKVPEHFKMREKDKPDMAITRKENISSVFVPKIKELNQSITFGFGDNKGTNDAILIEMHTNDLGFVYGIEIFVARGQKHNQLNLYRLMVDGDLDFEMDKFRNEAKKKVLPKQ